MLAEPVVAGLPMTSLLRGTPDAEIWKSADLGHCEEEVVKRFEHVVYSLAPSEWRGRMREREIHQESRERTVIELPASRPDRVT